MNLRIYFDILLIGEIVQKKSINRIVKFEYNYKK